jgi:two-component system cell cycle sensor histidine kinase/response regulator CckA
MPLHSLLRRQLKRHFGDPDAVPAEWRAFIDAVNQAYRQADTDRLMIERSLDLSSEELGNANAQMREAVSALQRAHLELESRVADRTRELTEANASLRRANAEQVRLEDELRQAHKMEAVGRLAGGVAHDFNNLLVVIVGQAECLLRTDGDADHQASVREILQSAESAAALTRQLLVFSRRQMVAPTVLDLNALVKTTSGLLRRLIGEHIELELILGEGSGSVSADAGQLQQVLLNLGANARDAMPQGGKLVVSTSAETVASASAGSSLPRGTYAVLTVADTGVGMNAEVRARIFEPFFTTKSQAHGTGLGLATAYGIITQSKGHLDVTSEPGKGATFRAWLPQVPSPAQETAVPDTPSSRPTAGIVLVAEDQEPVRRIVCRTLAHDGYEVLDAEDGAAALERAQSMPRIDLLITDLVMPRMGGRALAEHLVAARPGLKVIYMTGYANDAEVAREVRDGSRLLLTKPFRAATLLDTVREALSPDVS